MFGSAFENFVVRRGVVVFVVLGRGLSVSVWSSFSVSV